jgi:nitroimidazol reductase NimA-like FMN-containing flavoprotein (pyridoxamine 5'-phosphate oxidase superfamily)
MTVASWIDPLLPARLLSPGECRDCLLRRHEGRLAYSTGRGPRCVVVNYAVHDDEIVLRVPEFNEICQYAPGCEVCLVIDEMRGSDDECSAWFEVTASGVASVVDHCEHTSREGDDLDEVWPAGVTASTLRVPIAELHGVVQETYA